LNIFEYDEIEIDKEYRFSKTFSEEDVLKFAKLSGDYNLVHLDEDYAKGSIFQKRIVHGFLSASLISTVIGTQFPGIGTIYCSQDLKFLKPVYIGDTVTAIVKATDKNDEKKNVFLDTKCINQNNEIVITGQAIVKAPLKKIDLSIYNQKAKDIEIERNK